MKSKILFTCLFCSNLCFASIDELVPTTLEEVKQRESAAIEMLDRVSPNTSLREWDHLITHLGVEHNLLTHLDWMRSDEALIAAGKESSIKQVFQEKISKELIDRLRSERKEWTYFETGASQPIYQGEFSLLSWNTLLMPPIYSQLFGGAKSWPERIDRIAELILDHSPDVISLCEVHDEEAAWALFELLKDDYGYFIFNAGENNLSLNLDEMTLNSGLFIASKYPKGYLSYSLRSDTGVIAHVISTHLQPYKDERSQDIRAEQLAEVYTHMQMLEDKPVFLAGDLNIPYLGEGYDKTLLSPDVFYDAYTDGMEEVTLDNQTDTDFFKSYYRGQPEKCVKEGKIVDYILLLRETAYPSLSFTVEKIDVHDFDHPDDNLSDHHALLGRVKS